MKTITNITYPASALFAFAWFTLAPQARAVCQEGCFIGSNTVLGDDALLDHTGDFNTAIGFEALFSNHDGNDNTATGFQALFSNTDGSTNTANGSLALFSNTDGSFNTAIGFIALYFNTTGNDNTAVGADALKLNTTGSFNTATGANALFQNTTGGGNTAIGFEALTSNIDGNDNTATGDSALVSNATGNSNTANGLEALLRNTTGNSNTAIGMDALSSNTTGNNNIALGVSAGGNLHRGNNNVYIGNAGNIHEDNKIRIGTVDTQKATFIAGISGVTVPAGVGVIVGTDGKLGTVVSSERFKDEIDPMDKASEAIFALKPVTFRYKPELDPDSIPQFGLVAEDVEKINPDLVVRDTHGKPFTVRYEAVNAMLLNEFLKEHRTVQKQETTIAQLKSALAQQQKDFQATAAHQQKQIEALAIGLQKVSAQLELSKAAPNTVSNNH